MNIAEENAVLAQQMMIATIPGIIIQTFTIQMMGFCTAQKIDKPFGIASIFSTTVCCCLIGYLVNDLKVGV